jgi:hypothetical protein
VQSATGNAKSLQDKKDPVIVSVDSHGTDVPDPGHRKERADRCVDALKVKVTAFVQAESGSQRDSSPVTRCKYGKACIRILADPAAGRRGQGGFDERAGVGQPNGRK